MLKKRLILLFFLGSFANLFAQGDSARRVVTPHVSPVVKFTENLGQWEDKILFRAQLDGGALYLEKKCLTFSFYDKKKLRSIHNGGFEKKLYKDYNIMFHAYKVHFEGCNTDIRTEKYQKGKDYENFFIGSDKSKWKGNVQNYSQVWLKNLYDGIDYEAIASANGMKYNFHLQPNANAQSIKMRYEGVDKIKLRDGAVTLKLEVNTVVEQKPYAYQLINGVVKQVTCKYKLTGNVLGFDFPDGYDKNYELVIDPVLVFAAQSGSLADNFGMTGTFDQQGNLYSGGTVFGSGYPFVTGSFSNAFNGVPAYGNTDIVLTKYNATGTALIYSTYMGGNGTEVVSSLIVDKANNLYLYGATGSTNFPITGGCAFPLFAGGQNIGFISNGSVFFNGTDIYVAKFNPTGSALIGSTFYGGSGNDGVNYLGGTNSILFNPTPTTTSVTNTTDYDSLQTNYGDTYRGEIQLDTLNNVYIVSSTRSADIPIVGGFDATLGGKQDAIIAKFNTNLTTLIYSTYLGGSKIDCGNGLFVLPNFEVFVTGGTCSNDFSVTAAASSTVYNGGKTDGFLSKINASGNTLLQSTYIGTPYYDNSFFVQCNVAGQPHVYGQSVGIMPVILPPSATSIYSVANSHQFITKYDNSLSTKIMSTIFGSGGPFIDISPSAFAVDECNGNIYLSGWGGNILTAGPSMSNMPLLNPTQSTTNGYDFYLMALTPNAGSLLYGSYFGGNVSQEHVDGGTSRFDRKGIIYQSVCAGCGGNSASNVHQDFPVTPGAWPGIPGAPNQNTQNYNCNNGVFKIDFKFQNTIATINTNTIVGCAPLTVSLTNATPGTSFTWSLGPGNTNSVNLNPVVTFPNPGTFTVSLVVHDTTKCIKKDSAIKIITVHPKPLPAFTATVTPCLNTYTATNTSTGTANTFAWNFGDATATSTLANPTHTFANSGTYTVTLIATNTFGCKDSVKQPVNVFIFNPGVANGSVICQGYTANISASGGTSYTWSPTAQVSNSSIANPVVSPTTTSVYTVTILNTTAGNNCLRTLTTSVLVNPKPNANFNSTSNPCGGGVYFNDLSAANITAWQWTLSPTATSTVQNPYNFYSTGGNYSITLIVTNSDGCKDTTVAFVPVVTPPPVSVNSGSIICKGKSAQLVASGGVSYSWTPAATLDLPLTANPSASPTVSTQYSVVITSSMVVGGNQCQFLLVTGVNVTELSTVPIAAVANPVIVTTGGTTTLTYLGSPGVLVTWLPIGSTIPTTGYTVTAHPDRPTTYTAVATLGPCRETTTVNVEAYSEGCIDGDVFVPNTFTPNGDGKNDFLFVRGIKVDEVYFAVYNRWGEKVFDTNDKTKGWDGIYKSRPADVGVFGWYLKVKCINGEENFKKGNVTLIR